MKNWPGPKQVIAWSILAFLYVVLTVRLIFIAVPQMLREADTVVNILGFVAVLCWALISYYCVWMIVQRKRKPSKGKRR